MSGTEHVYIFQVYFKSLRLVLGMFTVHRGSSCDIRRSYVTCVSAVPFAALPILEVDGEVLCQSQAFERLVAKRLGYVVAKVPFSAVT